MKGIALTPAPSLRGRGSQNFFSEGKVVSPFLSFWTASRLSRISPRTTRNGMYLDEGDQILRSFAAAPDDISDKRGSFSTKGSSSKGYRRYAKRFRSINGLAECPTHKGEVIRGSGIWPDSGAWP